MTVAYGKQEDGAVSLGSLDLLDPQRTLGILDITATSLEGMGEKEKETWSSLPHSSFDLVIMNPPFTRATGHHEINDVGVPNPMFAAFNSTEEEQQEMSKATKRLTKGTSAHGNAGEASIFLVLADRKLRPGGTIALVMPVSLVSGDGWERSRLLLAKNYSDLIVASIAAAKDKDMSFSADTDMGECLIVARKNVTGSQRATFVSLKRRPASTLLGANAATQIRQLMATHNLQILEDGPSGGTPLYFGADEIGRVIDAPLPTAGGWNLSRVADFALAQTAYQLTNKTRVWLPTMEESDAVDIPTTTIKAIGKIGPLDRDINGDGPGGSVRGPFVITDIAKGSVPTYPALWSHDADRERTLMFPGDSDAQPRRSPTKSIQKTIDSRVAKVWATASHCHHNRDFRFNSQSTAMQYTAQKTIGGRAWLSLRLPKVAHEKAMVAWSNTSLGLLLYWWHANKQQSGRGYIAKSAFKTMPTLDVTVLTPQRLMAAAQIFDSMNAKPLLAMNKMDTDPTRKELDDRFAVEVLGLKRKTIAPGGPFDLLRSKLAAEPSVRGANRRRAGYLRFGCLAFRRAFRASYSFIRLSSSAFGTVSSRFVSSSSLRYSVGLDLLIVISP